MLLNQCRGLWFRGGYFQLFYSQGRFNVYVQSHEPLRQLHMYVYYFTALDSGGLVSPQMAWISSRLMQVDSFQLLGQSSIFRHQDIRCRLLVSEPVVAGASHGLTQRFVFSIRG